MTAARPTATSAPPAGSIGVVIVNWNGADVIGPCLDSLLRQEVPGELRIVVVDNGSTDASLDVLARYEGRIELAGPGTNLGFGKGNNVGFRALNTEFVVALNPDTEVLEVDGLARMIAPLQADPGIGMVGPRIVNRDGSLQQSCANVPSIANMVASGLALGRLLPDDLRRRWATVLWSHDRSSNVGWVGGAALAMRSVDYARIGGFSERTFMYGEDLELGYQVARLGLRVFYDHDIRVLHLGDHSSSQVWSDAETAAKIADGEVTFLYERYRPRIARLGTALLWATYRGRAALLGLLGRRERAEIYGAMSRAIAEHSEPTPAPRSSLAA